MTRETAIHLTDYTDDLSCMINEPKCGGHDTDLYSVSYDDAGVLIDRQTDSVIEIRVWRNGREEDYPYAKMTFEIDTLVCGHRVHSDVESAECDECEFCANCYTHAGDNQKESYTGRETILKCCNGHFVSHEFDAKSTSNNSPYFCVECDEKSMFEEVAPGNSP